MDIKKHTLKEKVFMIIGRPNNFKLNKIFNIVLISLILLNFIAVILESVKEIYEPYKNVFIFFEYFSVIFFCTEYILRIWSANAMKVTKGSNQRLKFIFSPMGLIDFISFAPALVLQIWSLDLRLARLLRLTRLFRLLKLARFSLAIKTLSNIFKRKKHELAITFLLCFFIMILSSCLMFYAEHEAQPEKFSNIITTMWWAMSTLTTIGYGDIYPITGIGKVLGTAIGFIGLGLFAVPAGIIASGFTEDQKYSSQSNGPCPTCGCTSCQSKESTLTLKKSA